MRCFVSHVHSYSYAITVVINTILHLFILPACADECDDVQGGLGLCTGLSPAMCCNFYENDVCVPECSDGFEPDDNRNCGMLDRKQQFLLKQIN